MGSEGYYKSSIPRAKQTGSKVFYEGLRQTYVIGVILFWIALVCGKLSLVTYFGEVIVSLLLKYIPYIPMLVIIYLLRWLRSPHARDFYCSLNISVSDIIKKYILISQFYVWTVFLIGIVPFFIKDAITVGTRYYWTYDTVFGNFQTGSEGIATIFSGIFSVAGTSLFVTGITLTVCALAYSTVAQFILTVAVRVMPLFIVELISPNLSKLFINSEMSRYSRSTKVGEVLWNNPALIDVAMAVFGVLLIWLGLRAIEKLRMGNAMKLSRFLNSVACSIISFCLILIAAAIVLLHLTYCSIVSFYNIVPNPESEIAVIQRWGGVVSTLPDKAPWLPVIALCCLSLILLIIITVRSTYRQTKKWIDYTIGFGALVLLCAASFGVFSVYYSDAVKRFAHDEVDYVRIIENVIPDGEFAIPLPDKMYLQDYSEEDQSFYLGYLGVGRSDYFRFVKTTDGNLHGNFNPGTADQYFSASEYDYYLRDILYATQWRNEIKDILLAAVNRDAETVETVIGACAPVPLIEKRRHLTVRLYMKDGSSYLRECFLTESEMKRVYDLLSAVE